MKRVSRTATNEILKNMSTWLRTLSLGLVAVAFLEPLRGASSPSALAFAVAFVSGALAFVFSILILVFMEDEA